MVVSPFPPVSAKVAGNTCRSSFSFSCFSGDARRVNGLVEGKGMVVMTVPFGMTLPLYLSNARRSYVISYVLVA